MKEKNAKLIIAGPDEGELEKIESYLGGNAIYVGPVYGAEKIDLLKRSHYYVLPSWSEGFPTSVVEAMSFGVIPVISNGCNFPEIFENELGYLVEPREDSLAKVLESLASRPFDPMRSKKNFEFVRSNNSQETIGKRLYELYSMLIKT